jgi:hypothetical protein
MRALFLALLLANLAFFAWSQGWLAAAGLGPATQREPQRLALQIHPGQVHVTPLPAGSAAAPAPAAGPSAASSAAAAAASSASPSVAPPAASAPAASAASAAATSAPASAAPAASPAPATVAAHTVCRQIGPFGAMQTDALAQAQAALAKAGLHAQAHTYPVPPQWMVLLGPFPSRDAMQTVLDSLQRNGQVKVFAPVSGRPRYEPGISLGVFSTEAAAQEQLLIVGRQGVQGAKVVQRNAGMERTVLRLPALTPAQLDALARISGQLGGQMVKTCEQAPAHAP